MKLAQSAETSKNRIRKYAGNRIFVNELTFSCPIIVTPDRIWEWPVENLAAITPASLALLDGLPAQSLLIGTGRHQHFIDLRELIAVLAAQGIGCEAMSTPAACRTYNLLLDEGRQVAAALLPPDQV